ncbi:hypothetical protein GCM10027421_27770 [Microbacterium shaanxiense]
MPSKGERLKAMQARHRYLNFLRMMDHLSVHACTDCGESDPVVLDFDHLPGVDKRFEISRAVSASTRSWSLIESEIAKCEVVCANCHRRRTSERAGHRKHLIKMGIPIPVVPATTAHRTLTPHGGGSKGRRGCLCEPCRQRRNAYAREWRVRRKNPPGPAENNVGQSVANLEDDPQ